jgi:ketosteroid isomerase-like protein
MWFDAFNRRDAGALMGLVDADFEWETSLTPVQGETIRGASGIADFFDQLEEVWEELTVTVDGLEAVGDRVVISGRWHGRGRSSGATIDQPSAWVMQMRNGRMLRSEVYATRTEALEAAAAA